MRDGQSVRALFPVRTVANSRRSWRITAHSAGEFERGLAEVGWFADLGQPTRWDAGCVRVYAWEQCPSPLDAVAEALAGMCQEFYDRIFAASPLAAGSLQELFDRIQEIVIGHARAAVPYNPERDPNYAPTRCVWEAAYAGGLIGCALASGWPVPDDLVELWNWFEAGHWPPGFANEPGDKPNMLEDEVSFPRRLLVY